MSTTTDILIGAGVIGGAWYFTSHRAKAAEARAKAAEARADDATNAAADAKRDAADKAAQAAAARDRASAAEARAASTVIIKPAPTPAPPPPPPPPAPQRATTVPPDASSGAGATPSAAPGKSDAPPAVQPLSREFDPLFAAFAPTIPIPYMRALAFHESKLSARGLFQIADAFIANYNQSEKATLQQNEMDVPTLNIAVAAKQLGAIVDSYQKSHPDVPNLRTDWSNPSFVELVTFGWNAGYSEQAGVGRVASYLEGLRITDMTVDDVARMASIVPGATKHLADPRHLAYCHAVAKTYLTERARDQRDGHAVDPIVVIGASSPAHAATVAAHVNAVDAHDAQHVESSRQGATS